MATTGRRARALPLRGDFPAGRAAIRAANDRAPGVSAREASHPAFYTLVLSGRDNAAIAAATEQLKTWPRDAMLLSLCTSVFGLIGFPGHPGREREQVALTPDIPDQPAGFPVRMAREAWRK